MFGSSAAADNSGSSCRTCSGTSSLLLKLLKVESLPRSTSAGNDASLSVLIAGTAVSRRRGPEDLASDKVHLHSAARSPVKCDGCP